MAAPLSQGARATSPAERFQLVRELGSRAVPVWAAIESSPNAKNRLVVVHRVARAKSTDEEIAAWTATARRLATLEHPHVARTRDVVTRTGDVLVVGDYIDGVRWSELSSSSPPPSLELALRVIVDLLVGLSALHNLRDEKRQPLKLVHGELTPECVIVGLDGVTRLVDLQRVRSGAGSGTEAARYLAPEVLLAGDTVDERSDIFSVGVLLWEALSGRPLFAGSTASAIVTQVLGGQVPRAVPTPASAWATPLVDTVAKALSAEPDARFGSAATFAAELRRIGGAKIAPPTRMAALIRTVQGDRIRARRQGLEQQGAAAVSIDARAAPGPRPASAPTTQPKAPTPAPAQAISPTPASPKPPPASPKPSPPTPGPRERSLPTPSAVPVPPPLPPTTLPQARTADRPLRAPPPLPPAGVRVPSAHPKPVLPVPPTRTAPPALKPPPLPLVPAAASGAVGAPPEPSSEPVEPESVQPEPEGAHVEAQGSAPPPKTLIDAPPTTAPSSPPVVGRPRKAVVVASCVALGAAAAVVAWWIMPTTPRRDAGPPLAATALSHELAKSEGPPSEPLRAAPPAQATPDPPTSAEPSEPTTPAPPTETPAPVAVAPVGVAPVAGSVTTPVTAPAPAPPSPVTAGASPRPVSKPKYDPEGI